VNDEDALGWSFWAFAALACVGWSLMMDGDS
jgi:hypothetical protein